VIWLVGLTSTSKSNETQSSADGMQVPSQHLIWSELQRAGDKGVEQVDDHRFEEHEPDGQRYSPSGHASTMGQSIGAFLHVSSKHLYGKSDGHVTGVPHADESVAQVPSAQAMRVIV